MNLCTQLREPGLGVGATALLSQDQLQHDGLGQNSRADRANWTHSFGCRDSDARRGDCGH